MVDIYKMKKYFWSLFGVIGVVTFWAGVWDGIGTLPYLESPLVSFIVGLAILTSSGLIFKQFNPLAEAEKSLTKVLGRLHGHPKKHEFHIKYFDRYKKRYMIIKANKLKTIEKSFLVLESPRKEVFVPIHRVKEVLHKNKTHWRA